MSQSSLATQLSNMSEIGPAIENALAGVVESIQLNAESDKSITGLNDDNKDVGEWFKKFDRISRSKNWSSRIKAIKVQVFLKGEALGIWKDLSQADKDDYEEVKYRIKRQMTRTNSKFVAAREFYGAKQIAGEKASVFAQRLKQYAKKMETDVPENSLVDQLMNGLGGKIRIQLIGLKNEDLQTVLRRARELEECYEDVEDEGGINAIYTTQKSSMKSKMDGLEKNMRKQAEVNWKSNKSNHSVPKESSEKNIQDQGTGTQPTTQTGQDSQGQVKNGYHSNNQGQAFKNRDESQDQCNFCGEYGHRKRVESCVKFAEHVKTVTCVRCNEIGHLGYMCKKFPGRSYSQKN